MMLFMQVSFCITFSNNIIFCWVSTHGWISNCSPFLSIFLLFFYFIVFCFLFFLFVFLPININNHISSHQQHMLWILAIPCHITLICAFANMYVYGITGQPTTKDVGLTYHQSSLYVCCAGKWCAIICLPL